MATVTIGGSSGASYTWATASYAWNSTQGSSSWAAAAAGGSFTCDVTEDVVSFAEARASAVSKAVSDVFAFSEAMSKGIGLNPSEALNVAESFARTATFNRGFAESFVMAEANSKAIVKGAFAESFSLSEQIKRNAQAVVSDLTIDDGDLSQAAFAAMIDAGQPAGYDAFTPFLAGDYTYKNAIWKVTITSADESRASINELAVLVDVPDIKDGGLTAVSSSGTTVAFNRSFIEAPEVNVSLKGGAVYARPKITAITATDFTVVLVNVSGTQVAGSVTWEAWGY